MMESVFISVCIPAFKQTRHLQRLLDSIADQTYDAFEVIVTDDSPGNEVEVLCSQYADKFNLQYLRNETALGTPENWNQAIRHAKGTWIKLMHDDDWFSRPDALERFASAAGHSKGGLIFSGYADVFLSTGRERRVIPGRFRLQQLQKEPATLLSRNIIGPPSVTLYRKDHGLEFDKKMKWLVDVDIYIRIMEKEEPLLIPECLVSVGLGEEQVTASVHGAPEVEIPEHLYFLDKHGAGSLRHLLVYDYWWRFLRNFSLTSEADIGKYTQTDSIPVIIRSMMGFQKMFPRFILRTGVFSKMLMYFHYLLNRNKIGI